VAEGSGPPQRLLVEYLLATTLANRLQAITDVENLAEQRALERIGFRREGVLRGLAFIGGNGETECSRPGYEATRPDQGTDSRILRPDARP
jgi:RimJ/RimL family protein N-acetyltransferase